MLMGSRDFLLFMLRGGRTFSSQKTQQRWLLRRFALTSLPVVGGLAILHISVGNTFLASVQSGCTLLLLPIIYLLRRKKWLRLLELVCIGIVVVLLTTVMIDGGVDATGLYWQPVFPFLAFFILGMRRGWYWVTGFGLAMVSIAVLMESGSIAAPYGRFELNISMVIYIFYTALAALFETLREIRQDDMERKNSELALMAVKLDHARQHLEEKVDSRTASLMKTNEELLHEIHEHDRAKQALEESEQRYLQAQKMEALGTLVGGIAHDFNNMLSGINANLFLIKRQCAGNPDAIKHINNIATLSGHATEMIRQLLTFARRDTVQHQRFDAAPFFNEAVKLGRVSIPAEITFTTDIERTPAWINGNATQLQQVLFNLIGNARDAVEGVETPSIRVEMKTIEADAKLLRGHPELNAAKYLRLTVSDNGIGIPPENIHKVYEPFFSTKKTGKGTGLGLAMCYGSAQRHGGTIEIESEVGTGTSVHFYLPLAEQTSVQQPEDPVMEMDAPPSDVHDTILVVDDEAIIRSAHRSLLEALGFQVVEAEQGQQAVDYFHTRPNDISLVLMDIKMPVMDGFTAAEKIRGIQPDIPLIFLTAFHDENRDAVNRLPYKAPILAKPVTVEKLSKAISQQLLSRHLAG